MKGLVIVGALNVDLITRAPRLPRMGETIQGTAFQTAYGGKGANQACAAAKLGGKVSLCGCVGEDLFGREVVENLKAAGVDCSMVQARPGRETGTATILVCQGDNAIVYTPGANETADVNYAKGLEETLEAADLISLQLEIPLETVEYICSYANERKIPVMLNPSPAKVLPEGLIASLSYLVVNETECGYYTGVDVRSVEDAFLGLKKLLDMGCRHPIITLGEKGAVYEDGGCVKHIPARKVEAVDSTAAGDTFTAALAVRLLAGDNMDKAVNFAVRASAITVTRMGAQSSIPDIEEVLALAD